MQNNTTTKDTQMTPHSHPRSTCPGHESLLVEVATLAVVVKNLDRVFRWSVGALLTVTIVFMGGIGTFAYKASELHAQVRVNTSEISNLRTVVLYTKEIKHGE